MAQWETLHQCLNGTQMIDLSPTLENGIPRIITHPQIIINPTYTHEHDGYYSQTLFLDEQSGAHVDCPAYMLPDQMDKTIDTYPVNTLFASAVKYDLFRTGVLPGEYVTREDILLLEEEMQDRVSEGEIALLDFGWMQYWANDAYWKHYAMDAPGLSEDAVALFAERKVKAVGTDTIACDTPIVNGKEYFSYGHKKYWLPNGILMMKMLANLDKLPTRSYFMAIPLKIKNGSGSPIRPLAIIE